MISMCCTCEETIPKKDPCYIIKNVRKGPDYMSVELVLCEDCFVKMREWMYKNFSFNKKNK